MIQKNLQYIGSNNRKSVYDLTIPENFKEQILIFIHGYKGYKDWGAWNIFEQAFTNDGFGFCKFNLSHNGGTIENLIDFPDLEAFANNRYSYELADTNTIIDLIHQQFPTSKLILIGHSRGGGNAILAGNHPAVTRVITLAGISSIAKRFSNTAQNEQWKKDGVRYEVNARTKQEMPLYYVQHEDFLANEELLNIEKAVKNLQKPCLHFHGTADTAVDISEGIALASWTKNPLYVLENSNHTFETSHPWNKIELSAALQEITNHILQELNQ